MRMQLGSRKGQALLKVEELENRVVPACTFSVSGSTLVINGDDGNNNIVITDNGSNAAGNLTVTCDGQTLPLPAANFSIIRVFTFDGNDSVTYTQTNNQVNNRKVQVDLGDDDDAFRANLPKDIRPDRILTIQANGGEDDDNLVVNARGFGLPAGARFNLTLHGDDDDDNLSVRYKDVIVGKLVYQGFGDEGEDNLFGDFIAFGGNSGTSTGRIVAQQFGGDDDDALTLLMANTGASTSPLNGLIDGGDGDNSCVHTANVATRNCEDDRVVVR